MKMKNVKNNFEKLKNIYNPKYFNSKSKIIFIIQKILKI